VTPDRPLAPVLVGAYEDATALFLRAARAVPDDRLDRHAPREWSARQIIHHVADAETQSYLRLRRLVAEPAGSTLDAFDEAAWADNAALGYRDEPVASALALIAAVRERSAAVLRRLSDDDLARYGTHSASGRYTLARWLEVYTSHPREHAVQLAAAARA
jgi:hypothetical protein